MKVAIEINLPIKQVFELFMDKSNYKEWKKDFISYEPLSGTPGETGAITRLVHKRVQMIETITSKEFPAQISAVYEHKRGEKTIMVHEAINHFTPLSDNRTLLEVDMEVTKVNGFLPRLMMKLMSGAGKKHAQGQLIQLKVFAEKAK